jgi:hypothetical protein
VDEVVVTGSQIRVQEVGFQNTPGQARDVSVGAESIACVADGASGLRLVDISQPAAPKEVSWVATGGWAESVTAEGYLALVADGENGVRVVDFTTPTEPATLAYYDTPGWVSEVAVLEGHAYVGDQGWGLMILGMWHRFRDVLFSHWAYRHIEAAADAGIVQGYEFEDEDDPDRIIMLYQPLWQVSRDQMAVFLARAHAGGDANVPSYDGAQAYFMDVLPDHWAWKYIMYCWDHNIVEGYKDPDKDIYWYHPAEVVSRDQMTVFIARARGWITMGDFMNTAGYLFPDVPAGYWCGTAIEACVDHEVVLGYPDGYFRPYTKITRDQMAVFVVRAYELPL